MFTTNDEARDEMYERVRTPSKRGFAALDAERRSEIARKGGLAAHAMGRAHRFTSQEGRDARAKTLQARTGDVAQQERL